MSFSKTSAPFTGVCASGRRPRVPWTVTIDASQIRILAGRTREGIWVGSQSRLSCPQDRGGGTLRRRGADFLGISAAASAGSSSGPSLSGCSWRAFHDVAFDCCDLSPARMCQGRQGRTAREGFARDREEHLRRPIHGPLQNCNVSGADGRPCGIRFRPNRFGRSFGRKFGVLYDDYVKNRFVSGCAINKMGEEVVLYTQEVHSSSLCAPTTLYFQ
jgi:hypothetical protein